METKKIIFDFGNVLIRIDEERTRQAFKELGADFSLEEQTELFQKLDKGQLTTAAFLEELRPYFPSFVLRRSLLEAWNALLLEIPESSLDLLGSLARKTELLLLSNTSRPHIRRIAEEAGPYTWNRFQKSFTHLYYSFDLGCRKPEKKIYEKVMKAQGWSSGSCILVDDRMENLEMAEKMGWTAVHFALDKGGDHKLLERELIGLL